MPYPECFDTLSALAGKAADSPRARREYLKYGRIVRDWLESLALDARTRTRWEKRLREIEASARRPQADEEERGRLYRRFHSILSNITRDAKLRAAYRKALCERGDKLKKRIRESALDEARREKLLKACDFIYGKFHLDWGPESESEIGAFYLDAWERGYLFKGAKLAEDGWRRMGRISSRFRDYGRRHGTPYFGMEGEDLGPLHPDLPENWHRCFLRHPPDFGKEII